MPLIVKKAVCFLKLDDCCRVNVVTRSPAVVFVGVAFPLNEVLTVGGRAFTVQNLFNFELVSPLAFP